MVMRWEIEEFDIIEEGFGEHIYGDKNKCDNIPYDIIEVRF